VNHAEPQLPAELQPLEAALASLSPRRDRLDHDLVLYRAGQLSVRNRRGWTPAILTGLVSAAATLLVTYVVQPEPRVVERIRIVHVPAATPQQAPTGPSAPEASPLAERRPLSPPGSRAAELERLDRMLQAGADPWPSPAGVAAGSVSEPSEPLSYRECLKALLESQPGSAGS
jgi:hypothetical protein